MYLYLEDFLLIPVRENYLIKTVIYKRSIIDTSEKIFINICLFNK